VRHEVCWNWQTIWKARLAKSGRPLKYSEFDWLAGSRARAGQVPVILQIRALHRLAAQQLASSPDNVIAPLSIT